jgi:hypothetical protein
MVTVTNARRNGRVVSDRAAADAVAAKLRTFQRDDSSPSAAHCERITEVMSPLKGTDRNNATTQHSPKYKGLIALLKCEIEPLASVTAECKLALASAFSRGTFLYFSETKLRRIWKILEAEENNFQCERLVSWARDKRAE